MGREGRRKRRASLSWWLFSVPLDTRDLASSTVFVVNLVVLRTGPRMGRLRLNWPSSARLVTTPGNHISGNVLQQRRLGLGDHAPSDVLQSDKCLALTVFLTLASNVASVTGPFFLCLRRLLLQSYSEGSLHPFRHLSLFVVQTVFSQEQFACGRRRSCGGSRTVRLLRSCGVRFASVVWLHLMLL